MLTVEPINAGMWMDSHLQVADESSGNWYDSGYPESQPLLASTVTCEGRGELLMDQGQAGSPQHHIGTMNSGTGGITKDQPDPDAIKMFVGQVPRHMDENDLRKMFEEYGQVYQINVLRDKVTGHSKGCCFVTFYTRKAALHAQNELHNIKTMAGMHHPIQMKPADTENRNERKLFIGMLAKKCSENDVRLMFSPFGQIEECTVLRDQNGQSKGCAFVTFSSRQCAISAIKAIHQSQTMEGCSAPVVVKFADTQKEKDAKRLQQMAQNLWNAASMNVGAINPQYLAQLSPNQSNLTGLNVPQLGGLNALAASQLLAASQGAVANNPQGIQNLQNIAALQGSSLTNSSTLNSNGDLSSSNLQALMANLSGSPSMNPISLATLAALTGAGNQGLQTLNPSGSVVGQSSTPTSMGAVTPVSSLAIGNVTGSSLSTIASLGGLNGLGSTANGAGLESLGSYSGIQQYTAYPTYAQSALQSASSPAGKQIEGPEGANLFIYHLPQEFSDSDLAQTFMPFGNVISAKVFIDKQTNLSKCFGFVSYDNPMCSQAAIQAMNGFQIGTKRLKVQLKRSKDASKPY